VPSAAAAAASRRHCLYAYVYATRQAERAAPRRGLRLKGSAAETGQAGVPANRRIFSHSPAALVYEAAVLGFCSTAWFQLQPKKREQRFQRNAFD